MRTPGPTSQKPGPYYTAPDLVSGHELTKNVEPETVAQMTVGSDLVLVVNKYEHGHSTNRIVTRLRVEAYDSDFNFQTVLLDATSGRPTDLLALAYPVAERLFPNHLLTEQN